jgi:histidine ammonia-lyase
VPTADRTVLIGATALDLEQYRAVVSGMARVALAPEGRARMERFRASLRRQLDAGARIYGVNTGYGADSSTSLEPDIIALVQRNTLTSHSVGTGSFLSPELTRGMLLLKANMLALGYSGVRPAVAELCLELLNHDILPLIPEQGSLAASGDLIPQGHLGQALLGEGDVRWGDQVTTAAAALSAAGLTPLAPEAKEGLALVNGTAFTTAHALDNVMLTERLLTTADICAAASLQALRGCPAAFDERIVATRPFPGAIETARLVRALIAGSPLLASPPSRVHDPYCLRCVPQIHGASRDAFSYVRSAALLELNAETDNPLVFPEDDLCLSGGNFHSQPVGIPMDVLSILVAELGSVSQRRTQHLVAPVYDVGLPPKLSPEPKLGSGLFMLNTAASALVSENRSLSFPATVDNMAVDTTEDHVSMASVAARKASWIIRNTAHILALELICACQALDLHRPLTASAPIEAMHEFVRGMVPFVESDRSLSQEVAEVAASILRGEISEKAQDVLGRPLS